MLGSEWKLLALVAEPLDRRNGVEDTHGFARHLGTHAVSCDDGDLILATHQRSPQASGLRNTMAIPCPPPMHALATPCFLPLRFICMARVRMRRVPVAPSG